MPSFDVVSEIDQHELSNAVDQTNREVGTRFDFKGSDAKVEQGDGTLELSAQSEMQVNQMREILYQRMSKRGIDVLSLEEKDLVTSGKTVKQTLLVKQGISADLAKTIVKKVKESKIKAQAAIQGDQVRITGKKRDDLQQIIAMLRGESLDQPLQFTNFRD